MQLVACRNKVTSDFSAYVVTCLGCTDALQRGPAQVCSPRLALSKALGAGTQHVVDGMTDPEHGQCTWIMMLLLAQQTQCVMK